MARRPIIDPTSSQFLRGVVLERDAIANPSVYRFSLPAFANFERLDLHPHVTYLIGENGSGKSTLLEALAVVAGFNPEGGSPNFNFATRESHSQLAAYLRPMRGIRRPSDGYFLRAESFYNVASEIERLDSEGGGPRIIDFYGGISLHEQSHGESFFALFLNRLGGAGLYLFDEPEAALSPTRQLAFIARLHQLVRLESQFIIDSFADHHGLSIRTYPATQRQRYSRRAVRRDRALRHHAGLPRSPRGDAAGLDGGGVRQ